MAVEAVAAGLGGAGGGIGPSPGAAMPDPGAPSFGGTGPQGVERSADTAQPVREASLETRTGRAGGPAEAPVRGGSVPEVSAALQRTGPSMGHRVLDGVDRLQRGDAAWSVRGRTASPTADGPQLRVAAREPGPAAAHLRQGPSAQPEIAGHPTTQPGASRNQGFDGMVDQLQKVSDQVVQVSIVSKTTSSFTGSLNKLLSSG